jgi:hypothetical protein
MFVSQRWLKWRGKTTAVAKDTPGLSSTVATAFTVMRRVYEEGMADIPMLDKWIAPDGIQNGPFNLMDFIGHDVNYVVTESVFFASLLILDISHHDAHQKTSGWSWLSGWEEKQAEDFTVWRK